MRFEIAFASFGGGGLSLILIFNWLKNYVADTEILAFLIFFFGGYGLCLLAIWMDKETKKDTSLEEGERE